jgi:hypothetical protein
MPDPLGGRGQIDMLIWDPPFGRRCGGALCRESGFVPTIARLWFTGLAAVAITASCSGDPTARTLSLSDLERITTIQPAMPGWDWPPSPIPRNDAPASESPSNSDTATRVADPLDAALEQQIADAGGIIAADGSRWQDADKLGVTFAWLLKDSAGARLLLAAERTYERGWAERDRGTSTDLRIDGLGDEAWAIVVTDSPAGQMATYGWRRNRLVLMAHVQCIFKTCPSEVGLAVRAWVDAIDHEAAAAIADPATDRPST